MERVWGYRDANQSLEEMGFTCVAVQRINDSQRHLGILHRGEEGGVEMLHLAWHMDLRNEAPRPALVLVRPDLRASRARSVATMCRLISERHLDLGLPYGLSYRVGRFDPQTAELLLDDGAVGLTCATFVLAVFASCGVHLIDTENWPERPQDAEWHEAIIAALSRRASPEHIAAVSAETGCARFRPEEVAGACSLEDPPSRFEEVVDAAHQVMAELGKL